MTSRFSPVSAFRFAAALMFLALTTATSAHAAIAVTCVEASRYKYLYAIFNNDAARFAAFFGTDPRNLPPPEACRALLITGTIDRRQRGEQDHDFSRLANAIAAGNGWVSTLYLASPGGNVGMGLRLAQMTRLFWLNTYAVDGPHFDYVPDFLGPNGPGSTAEDVQPEFQNGWRNYIAATQGFARVVTVNPARNRPLRCISACTFIHAGGVHRYGPAYFHRARRGRSQSPEPGQPSMSDLLDNLHRTEQLVIAFYRAMDTGEAAIQAYQSTATQTTASAPLLPMPRYISDYLATACKAPRQGRPRNREQAESASPGFPAAPTVEQQNPPPAEPPQAEPQRNPATTDPRALQCQISSHTRERLTQFARLCPNGCDVNRLMSETGRRLSPLMPAGSRRQQEPSRQQPRQGGQPQSSYPQPGYPPSGSPRGVPPQGYPPQSAPPRGYHPQQAYPPQGYPRQGYPQPGYR